MAHLAKVFPICIPQCTFLFGFFRPLICSDFSDLYSIIFHQRTSFCCIVLVQKLTKGKFQILNVNKRSIDGIIVGHAVAKVNVSLEGSPQLRGFVQPDRYRNTRAHNRVVGGYINRLFAIDIKKQIAVLRKLLCLGGVVFWIDSNTPVHVDYTVSLQNNFNHGIIVVIVDPTIVFISVFPCLVVVVGSNVLRTSSVVVPFEEFLHCLV
mmetsp:Transcript_24738/g.68263  ORF Transcript_24738/g.68263 Transcript_24738/m.68263 type:complete len:208 (+) Transcript_24738:1720-2343(+)